MLLGFVKTWNKIKKRIKSSSEQILRKKELTDLQRVLQMPNVDIHSNTGLSSDITFFVSPEAKKVLIGANSGCRKYCNILVHPNASLLIHSGVYFNNYCSLNCLGHIEIGENTLVGEGVKIYDHNHKYAYSGRELIVDKADFTIGRVVIGKNCWISSNVTILNNVEIGDNVIIGANCLIYKSVPANSIVKHAEQLIITQANTE